jgi:predicted permease
MPAGNLSFGHIAFLTFQAVTEVIIVCLTGFWAAKTGLLSKSAQKQVSALNVDLFTPAMIFSKLAPSLSFKKLFEIFIIPLFYAVSTGISYITSRLVSGYLNLNEPESNFVTAMSVFGNSNSLPVSLTLALSYTLPNLEWDDVENDSRQQIASRGILYLLVFQQIGQVLRWSWGYNTLLKRQPSPLMNYTEECEIENPDVTDGIKNNGSTLTLTTETVNDEDSSLKRPNSDLSSTDSIRNPLLVATNYGSAGALDLNAVEEFEDDEESTFLSAVKSIYHRFMGAMNPPLWAMVASLIVASIHPLQHLFFLGNGFVQNTVTKAIDELGGVCIPLILIVLGSNLYPSAETPPATPRYTRIVIGSLVSRMIIPPLILLPLIALSVKIFPVSILDDPIFLVVAFILTISPPAIQLSQICQLNELYEKEMAGVLFWGYAVLTLPATIGIVAAALSVLQWAKPVVSA